MLSFVPHCGECYTCTRGQGYLCEKSAMQAMGGLLDGTTRLTSNGAPLFQMACLGTFGSSAIVPEISMVKIPDDVPLDVAALIGCGVLTGVGAALNTASIRAGDTVAVVGCGGVGLNVIQGAAHRRRRRRSSPSTGSTRSSRWPSSSAPPTSSTPASATRSGR